MPQKKRIAPTEPAVPSADEPSDEPKTPRRLTRRKVRERLAIFWIIFQIATVLSLLVATFGLNGMSTSELTTIGGIIVPILIANTSLIVRYFLKNSVQEADTTPEVNTPFLFISAIFPISLFAYLNAIIFLYAYKRIDNIEAFKGLVALGEITFGVYAGMIIGNLFEAEQQQQQQQPGK